MKLLAKILFVAFLSLGFFVFRDSSLLSYNLDVVATSGQIHTSPFRKWDATRIAQYGAELEKISFSNVRIIPRGNGFSAIAAGSNDGVIKLNVLTENSAMVLLSKTKASNFIDATCDTTAVVVHEDHIDVPITKFYNTIIRENGSIEIGRGQTAVAMIGPDNFTSPASELVTLDVDFGNLDRGLTIGKSYVGGYQYEEYPAERASYLLPFTYDGNMLQVFIKNTTENSVVIEPEHFKVAIRQSETSKPSRASVVWHDQSTIECSAAGVVPKYVKFAFIFTLHDGGYLHFNKVTSADGRITDNKQQSLSATDAMQ